MQTSTQETAEQNSDTASNPALNFKWPAKLVLKSSGYLLCCSSDPSVKGVMQNLETPAAGPSSGNCNFSVPASQLPSLGGLTVQVTTSPLALQLTFFQGTNAIGVFSGSITGGVGAIGGATCKFEFGAC